MNLNVGSQNKTKVRAVEDAAKLYPDLFLDPRIVGLDVGTPLFGHPKNLKETVEGAVDRAKRAFVDCKYSFGLEGGLMEVPFTKSGFMEVAVCVIYNGKDICVGLGHAFEWPKGVAELILADKADGSKAFKELGYTEHEKLGAMDGGISGFLTKGRMTREDQLKQAIVAALIRIEHPKMY